MRTGLLVAALLLAAGAMSAQTPAAPPAGIVSKGGEPLIEIDRNEDGVVDYRIMNGFRGLVEREELDYNYDGAMDDFYYYENGLLVREEIDSDYNGKVDIWVYLTEGQYIKRWERDLNGDGTPDTSKDFGNGAP